MIVLTAVSLVAILLALALGSFFLRVARLPRAEDAGDDLFLCTWTGLLLAGGLLMATAQVAPLNRYVLLVALLLGIVLLYVTRLDVARLLTGLSRENWLFSLAIFCVIALSVSLVTSRDLAHFDTAFYMLPQMIWLEDRGLVAGAGLLHHRFGYNSIWLALAAPAIDLSHDGRLVAIGGTIAGTLLAAHIVHSIARVASGSARPADWFLPVAALPGLASPWLLSSIVSSSPDIPVWILTVIIGWAFILDGNRRLAAAIALLAFGAVAIKVSAAPLVAGAGVYALWTRQINIRSFVAVTAFAVLTLGSVLLANIVTSGCPVFPAGIFCLPVPWAVPTETANAISLFVSQWPMLQNINPFNGVDIAAYASGRLPTLSLAERIRLIAASAHPGQWAVLAAIVGLACLAPRKLKTPGSVIALLTALLGLAYCFMVPAYRFAAGSIGMLLGLAFMVAVMTVPGRFKVWPQGREIMGSRHAMALATSGVVVLALLLSVVSRTSDRELRESGFAGRPTGLTARLLLPPPVTARQPNPAKGTISGSEYPLSEPTVWREDKINDVVFVRPAAGEQCWHTRLPCTPPGEPLNPLKLRDPAKGVAGGFVRP